MNFKKIPIIYHIVWATHSTRMSKRMKKYKIKLKNPIYLDINMRYEITKYLIKIIKEDKINILALNVLHHHVHLILICFKWKRDNIVRKLKGKTTQLYKNKHNIKKEFHLWQQKYNHKIIESEEQLYNTINYVKNNHIKHNISVHKGLQPLVKKVLCPVEEMYKKID